MLKIFSREYPRRRNFAYFFFKVHLHHFLKKKFEKNSQNCRNYGFYYNFCLMIKGSGSVPLPPRIREAQKHTDPQHCLMNKICNYFSFSQPARDSWQLQRCGCGRLLNTGSKKSHSLGDSRIGPPQVQFVLCHLDESRERILLIGIIGEIVRVFGRYEKHFLPGLLMFWSTDLRLPVI